MWALQSNFSCLSAPPKGCTIKNSQEHHNAATGASKGGKNKQISISLLAWQKQCKASPVAGVGVWCGGSGCARGAPGFSWFGSGSVRAVEPFARRESPRLSLSSSRAVSAGSAAGAARRARKTRGTIKPGHERSDQIRDQGSYQIRDQRSYQIRK